MQVLTEVIVANTIPLKPEVADNTTKIKVLSVGPLVAEVTTFSSHDHLPSPPARMRRLPKLCCVVACVRGTNLSVMLITTQTIRRLHTGESVSSMKESLQRGENIIARL